MTVIDTDQMSVSEILDAVTKAAMQVHYRDRDQFVAACPLTPQSLCGSYFRAPDQDDPGAEAAWLEHQGGDVVEGIVVGELHATPTDKMYLVEFFGREGATGRQQAMELSRMVAQRWAFYDSEGWLSMHGTPAEAKEEVA